MDLAWSGATSVRVYRDGVEVADVAGTSWTDAIGGKGSGQYVHQVCALDSAGVLTGVCSERVTTTIG